MIATQRLGKVSCSPKGAFVSANTYEYLDIVTNNNSSYIAKQAVPGGSDVTDTTYWQLLASKGDTGTAGVGIASTVVSLDSTSGLLDTYELIVTYTDLTQDICSFTVHNGNGISDITKVSTVGLVDTYEIQLDNGTTKNFTVTNGAKGDQGEKGNVCFATFSINNTTGILSVTYDAGYDGAIFSINNNGEMEVSLA